VGEVSRTRKLAQKRQDMLASKANLLVKKALESFPDGSVSLTIATSQSAADTAQDACAAMASTIRSFNKTPSLVRAKRTHITSTAKGRRQCCATDLGKRPPSVLLLAYQQMIKESPQLIKEAAFATYARNLNLRGNCQLGSIIRYLESIGAAGS
ncbi:hypothetical protein FBU30_007727, partial [Linnemannia zychae]